MTIKVSVIVPVFNTEKHLLPCLSSICEQTLREIEIIVINDGSTDSSIKIIEKIAEKESRITVINQKNRGLSEARNAGIKVAHGEYITFVDSDDTIEKNMLKDMYTKATHTNSDIVKCQYIRKDSTGKNLYTSSKLQDIDASCFELTPTGSLMACTKLFKKTLFSDYSIIFPKELYYEDQLTVLSLLLQSKKTTSINNAYYNWFSRKESISTSVSQKHIHDIFVILEKMYLLLHHNNKFTELNLFWTKALQLLSIIGSNISNTNNRKSKSLLEQLFLEKLSHFHLLQENKNSLKNTKKFHRGIYLNFLFTMITFKDFLLFESIVRLFYKKDIFITAAYKANSAEEIFFKILTNKVQSFHTKNILIYGANNLCIKYIQEMKKINKNVIALLDKNKAIDSQVPNISVYTLDEYYQKYRLKDELIVILSLSSAKEIHKDIDAFSKLHKIAISAISINTEIL